MLSNAQHAHTGNVVSHESSQYISFVLPSNYM